MHGKLEQQSGTFFPDRIGRGIVKCNMISFKVDGIPRPGGSKNAFKNPRTGGIIVTEAGKHTAQWRKKCAAEARLAWQGKLLSEPLSLEVTFSFQRPRSHYGSGKNSTLLKPSSPQHHTSKPDTTKLLRALEDALTGIIWVDDSQVVHQSATKKWDTAGGATVKISKAQ
jgi:Holliday junction resolvase RusA-like endonuclease